MNIEYKYKVGDKFDFGGNIEIVMCSGYNKDPQYWVRMTDGGMNLVSEEWLDARVNLFSSDKKKSDVYIPATPEEFKVGDRVEILASDNSSPSHTGKEGIIVADWGTGDYIVKFPDLVTLLYNAKHLRKLPDISRFDNPMDRQVGGEHYQMPIQPVEFIERNGLGFCVGNCIKYLCRYKKKNGREDLEKARHYIDLLIELEYPEDEKGQSV